MSAHSFLRRLALLATLTVLPAAVDGGAQTPDADHQRDVPLPGMYPQADVLFGSRVFSAHCAVCHGGTGDQIAGVDLLSGRFRRAARDSELLALLAAGIPGTAMPSFTFNAAEAAGIVAYLHKGRALSAANAVVGDEGRGRALFEGKGNCTSCHRIFGRGPRLAPDLTAVGARRTADALERVLVDPNGAIQAGNRSIRAVTRDGRTITGRRLNEDTYTVQLIDQQERLVSLMKADLREYTIVKESSMPSFKDTLTVSERADMLAYLLSLDGGQRREGTR